MATLQQYLSAATSHLFISDKQQKQTYTFESPLKTLV